MLGEQGETPLDLKFRLLTVPVRVHPFFWIICAIMGWSLTKDGFEYLLVWVACCFFSILMHEMGHVMMGRLFGSRGHIVLQGLCGLAIGSSNQYDRWKRVLVILAGPGIQLVFVTLLVAGLALFGHAGPIPELFLLKLNFIDTIHLRVLWMMRQPTWPDLLQSAVWYLAQINFYWALMNLLPVYPLDGGQISREFCTWKSPGSGVRISLLVSIGTAIVVALNSLAASQNYWHIPYVPTGGTWFAIFFAVLAVESYQHLQFENAKRARWHDPGDDDRLPWESDPDEWKRR